MGKTSVIFVGLFLIHHWLQQCGSQEVGIILKSDDEEVSVVDYDVEYDNAETLRDAYSMYGGPKFEPVRRSYLRKMKVEQEKHDLKKWLKVIKENDAEVLTALNELEFLVHQIDNADNFMSEGGIEVLFQLMYHRNQEIKSAALSVLIAAMQGNPTIQSYVETFNIIGHFRHALKTKSENLHKYIAVISCYLRNMPIHQLEFLYGHGMTMLAMILRDYTLPLSYKYKVIDLAGDLANEIYDNGTYDESETTIDRDILQSYFAFNINVSRICDEIPSYLQFEGSQEKVVAAMNALFDVCPHPFRKSHVLKIVQDVLSFYLEQSTNIDRELRVAIIKDLMELLSKITPKSKKDEL